MESAIKIISGGQTGVDRAALDVALDLGIPVGGWCPRGRWAEDGPIPERYPLVETRSRDVNVRTQRNVECSTATLVLTRGSPMGGTRFTVEFAQTLRRPLLVVDLSQGSGDPVDQIAQWIEQVRPAVLNIAGPRESGAPGISEQAAQVLSAVLERVPVTGETPLEVETAPSPPAG